MHPSIVRDIATIDQMKAAKAESGNADPSSVISYANRAILCVGIDEMAESIAVVAPGQGP